MGRVLLPLIAAAVTLGVGCSNGSSSFPIPTPVSVNSGSPPPPPTAGPVSGSFASTIAGNVFMGGPVSKAIVILYAIDPSSRKLAVLGAAVTDGAGAYSIVATLGGQACLIVAGGGSYTEDATGASHSLGSSKLTTLDDPRPGVLEAMIGSPSASGTYSSPVLVLTPVTTMGSRRVIELSHSSGAAVFAEDAVLLANQAVAQALNVGSQASPVDPRTLVPLDFTNANDAAAIKKAPLAAPALYGAALSGLSSQASTLGLTSSTALVDALAQDFADGTFDGMGPSANGVLVPVTLGSGTLAPTAGTTDLAQATSTFLDDPVHNTSGTNAAALGPQ